MIFIEVVALEKLLGGRIFQMDFIFFNGFCIFPFLVVYVILVKILVIGVWEVWCEHTALVKGIPREIFKPRMRFNFLVSVKTESAGSFTSETLKKEKLKGKKCVLTLLIKSAASRLQPSGTSFFLI